MSWKNDKKIIGGDKIGYKGIEKGAYILYKQTLGPPEVIGFYSSLSDAKSDAYEELGTSMYLRRKNFFIAKIVDKFSLGD